MPILPYLRMYRFRLVCAVALSVSVALLLLYFTSAESLTDVGVLWHHFCGCAPEASDVYALLYLPVATCGGIGVILGLGVGTGLGPAANGISTPGAAEMRFLFTRPTTRAAVLLTPLLIAATAITVLPAAGLLLLIGWLYAVHAPALGHLVDIARLMPSATNLGPHPGLLAVLKATHFARFYLSAISVGLCAYALYFGQRWWIRSPYTWLRVFGALATVFLPMFPALAFVFKRAIPLMLLNLSTPKSLYSEPWSVLILLHVLFAAICLLSAWQIARSTDL